LTIEKKEVLIETILKKQLGDFVSWQMPDIVPLLGPDYLAEITKLRTNIRAVLDEHTQTLAAQEVIDLTSAYDAEGYALTDELKSHWRDVKRSLDVNERTFPIYLAGLGRGGRGISDH
jgi:hypothetical protein